MHTATFRTEEAEDHPIKEMFASEDRPLQRAFLPAQRTKKSQIQFYGDKKRFT